jgi:hypothetical protein
MTAAQVQAFLQSRNSFLQNYSENGKTAAAIIKSAADTHQINPRIILVTLQKEQGLVSQTQPLSPTSQRMTKAMGSNLGNTFTTQIDEGCRALRRAFNVQTIPFYKIVTPYKVNASGQRVSSFLTQNHLYVVPSTGVRNVFAAVAFRVANKSTYAQHQFTNYVTHRLDAKASTVNLPAGGVYTFVSVWRSLFP